MSRSRVGERIALAIGGVLIGVPGVLMTFDTAGYVDGKDNLVLSPDMYSELRALGAIFIAAALTLLVGAFAPRWRQAALVVGAVAFVPQGVARVVSYAINEGQHDSYLRAGIVELIVGAVLVGLLVTSSRRVGDA